MKIIIHRGAAQVGGSCVELQSQGVSLLLDLGLPLDSSGDGGDLAALAPQSLLADIHAGRKNVKGLLISHAHQDHYGLRSVLPDAIPVYSGHHSSKIMELGRLLWGTGPQLKRCETFAPFEPFEVPPFKITPHLVDHSVFDAYGFFVEAGGKTVLYTGDFRAHGRKEGLFRKLKSLPSPDVLLMEGTLVGPRAMDQILSERQLESALVDHILATTGLVLVSTASTNIDRIVTIFKAAKQTGRKLVIDLYTALLLDMIENYSQLPKPSWSGIRVAFSSGLMSRFRQAGLGGKLQEFRSRGIKWPRIAEQPGEFVLLLKPSMMGMVKRFLAPTLSEATWVYSLWSGYLEREGGLQRMRTYLEEQGTQVVQLHTSGHARLADMVDLVAMISPKAIIPIHTNHPELFAEHFRRVVQLADGESYTIT